jgi:predicted amidohydrolase YtcJ/glyoxylase-like metal-dependent hydrolase (beta-lactamase superfamily II)
MTTIRRWLPWLLFAVVSLPAAARETVTVYYNGQIDTPRGWQSAMGIEDGRIVALGSDASVRKRLPNVRQIDLRGQTVLPGLVDMHVHPILQAKGEEGVCRIPQDATPAALLAIVAGCAKAKRTGEWVTGGQWQASALAGTPITAATLDAVSPDNPVMLFDVSGHSLWVNSKALAIAGITSASTNPEGGIIERDVSGEPTGILRETARQLVMTHIPPVPAERVRAALKTNLDYLLSFGITGFVEAMAFRDDLENYAALADAGLLKQHVQACVAYSAAGKINPDLDATIADLKRYTRPNFRADCVKVFADGVPTESHTAAMLEPYAAGQPNAPPKGLLLFDPASLAPLIAKWDKAGLTVMFHAAGDASARAAIDAIAYARKTNGMAGPIHQLAHSTFIAPVDLPRAKTLNVAIEYSPYLWSPQPINDDIIKAVGTARSDHAWAIRDGFASGALVIAGSDWAVVPAPDPWLAIETSITRKAPGGAGAAFAPDGAITLRQALDMFTINAAKRLGTARDVGTIEVGKRADFIVVDKNPFRIPVTDIHAITVQQTYIGGENVYARPSAGALRVDVFKGGFATVNSYIFSNGKSITVMDVQRKEVEAEKLADQIRAMKLPLTQILISHGHTDHFSGMALFRREFPAARIVVASEAIKRDIKAYAIYMDGIGATAAEPVLEPALKPKSAANPRGFDYESDIHVLDSNQLKLDGGGTLELTTDYLPAEADHATTVYSPDLNALFLADFGYNRVHFWLGDDISRQDIANWQTEMLRFKRDYASHNPVIYPGHGDPADMALFGRSVRYLDDFLRITEKATTRDVAQREMEQLYPGYGEPDFFLKYSIEAHVGPH